MNKYTQTYLNQFHKTAIDLQSLYGGGGIGAGNGTALKNSNPQEDNRPLVQKAYGGGLGISDSNGTAIKDNRPLVQKAYGGGLGISDGTKDNRPLWQKLFM